VAKKKPVDLGQRLPESKEQQVGGVFSVWEGLTEE